MHKLSMLIKSGLTLSLLSLIFASTTYATDEQALISRGDGGGGDRGGDRGGNRAGDNRGDLGGYGGAYPYNPGYYLPPDSDIDPGETEENDIYKANQKSNKAL